MAEKPNLRRASGEERVAFLGKPNWYKKPELSQCQRITIAPCWGTEPEEEREWSWGLITLGRLSSN